MAEVRCTRCGQVKPALAKAPFRDALGQAVLANTCADCWKEWLAFQIRLINEMRLIPVNPDDAAILTENLRSFLRLPPA